MPGIAGIVARHQRLEYRAAIRSMVHIMTHEAHDTAGFYECDKVGLWAGWTTHAGKASGCPPVWNETKDICLIFFGEHFSDGSETRELSRSGHTCSSTGAAWLVHLYEEKGPKCLEQLNGWFSGIVVDLREEKVIVFIDRFGLGRLYWHEDADAFYFASEAKALLKILPQLRKLDMRSLGEFLSCGCTMQGRTLFSGVSLLPGASAVTFNHGQAVTKSCYFRQQQWEDQETLSVADYCEQLKATFPAVLGRYFRDQERVAMSLTGGLDGRMIMAWCGQRAGSLPCYTFNGPYRDCEDVRVARKVAAACGQPHQTITVGKELLAEFPALAQKAVYLSDGTMDVTGGVELYVNSQAREVAPVRLTGNYGSEILRDNVAFKPSFNAMYFLQDEMSLTLEEARETYRKEAKGRRLSFITFKQIPWHHYSRFTVEQSQLSVRAPFLDNDLVRLVYRAPAEALKTQEPSMRLISAGNAVLGRIPNDRGVIYPAGGAVNAAKRNWHEFLAKAEYAYDYGMPQWLARVDHALAFAHIERLFLGRQKFYHFRVWYGCQLADFVKDMLLDQRTLSRPYLKRQRVVEIVKAHLGGQGNFTQELHKLLTIELIERQLIAME